MQRHHPNVAYELASNRIKDLEANADHWRAKQAFRAARPSLWARLVAATQRHTTSPKTAKLSTRNRAPKTAAEALTRVGAAADRLNPVVLAQAGAPLVRQSIRELLSTMNDAGIDLGLEVPDDRDDISVTMRTLSAISHRTIGLHIKLRETPSQRLAALIVKLEELVDAEPGIALVTAPVGNHAPRFRWAPTPPAACTPACV